MLTVPIAATAYTTSYFVLQVAFRAVAQLCVQPNHYNDHVKDNLMRVVLGHRTATDVKNMCDKLLGTPEMVAALATMGMPNVLSDAPFAGEFEVDDTKCITTAAAATVIAATPVTTATAAAAAAARGGPNSRDALAGTRSVSVQTTLTTQVCDTPLLRALLSTLLIQCAHL
jgi:hypothetical protein